MPKEEPPAMRRTGAGRRKADAPKLTPLVHSEGRSLAQGVYDTLRVALMSGAILPGISLTSRSLSEALKVSATPVRDALKRLEAEGALRSKSKSAFFLNDPDRREFEEIVDIRLKLEGLAIRRAAAVATPEALAPIRELNVKYDTLLNLDGPRRADSLVPNFQFHFQIYCLAGSEILVQMIESTWTRIGPTLHRFNMTSEHLALSAEAHWMMLDALAKNEPDAAEAALKQDIMTAYRDIAPTLRPPAAASKTVASRSFLSIGGTTDSA